ncbi:MAG: hypothetical protein HUU41_19710 [Bryobacteraceae bacterium]|nr:hypothetical protein [Bryobacterales bacterium]MEB2360048.1 hypothetical protein [Bryobacterales bacterium]NUN03339.1 hypothetical protein [Bryobacteraceae bacterium]
MRYAGRVGREAKKSGLAPEQVRKLAAEGWELRRMIVDEIPDVQALITDLNKVGAAELRMAERAIADSRCVSPATLDRISRRIEEQGPEGTLAQALEGDAREMVEHLVGDGVLTTAEEPRLLSSNGTLTAEGKRRMSRLLTGRLFEDARAFDEAARN